MEGDRRRSGASALKDALAQKINVKSLKPEDLHKRLKVFYALPLNT